MRVKPPMPQSVVLTGTWYVTRNFHRFPSKSHPIPRWDKWTLYGRFPWKILVHLLLIISCTTSIMLNSSQTAFVLSNTVTFYRVFWPANFDVEAAALSPANDIYLHTIDETLNMTQSIMNQV